MNFQLVTIKFPISKETLFPWSRRRKCNISPLATARAPISISAARRGLEAKQERARHRLFKGVVYTMNQRYGHATKTNGRAKPWEGEAAKRAPKRLEATEVSRKAIQGQEKAGGMKEAK